MRSARYSKASLQLRDHPRVAASSTQILQTRLIQHGARQQPLQSGFQAQHAHRFGYLQFAIAALPRAIAHPRRATALSPPRSPKPLPRGRKSAPLKIPFSASFRSPFLRASL